MDKSIEKRPNPSEKTVFSAKKEPFFSLFSRLHQNIYQNGLIHVSSLRLQYKVASVQYRQATQARVIEIYMLWQFVVNIQMKT